MTYEEILQYINSLSAAPIPYESLNVSNPNETTPTASMRAPSGINWGAVPGMEQFYSYDQANNQERIDPRVAEYAQQQGYTMMRGDDRGGQAFAEWLRGPDGKDIAESARITGTNDDNFKIAALLAAALAGGAAYSASGVGGAAGAGGGSGYSAADMGLGSYGAGGEVLGGGAGLGGAGNGAWLGEGVASGIPAWDAAGAGLAGGGSALTGAATSGLGSVLSGIDPTLLQLGGAALGALSSGDQEQKQTGTREPWGPAQDWIKSNITRGQELQKRYEQTPFSPQQAQAYQNLYGTINAANQMAPGLLGNFNQQMTQGYDRFAPKESRGRPTFSPLTAAWNPGLLTFGG